MSHLRYVFRPEDALGKSHNLLSINAFKAQGVDFEYYRAVLCGCKNHLKLPYHKRSNVETAFSMIKGKFGDAVRSKSDIGQLNEVLCKVLCHNLCVLIQAIHELGIEPKFQKPLVTSR